MPKGPKVEERPADVIGNAVHVMRIATPALAYRDFTSTGPELDRWGICCRHR